MKTNKFIMSAMMALALGGAMTSCSDFEEVNENPMSTGADKIKPYYSLFNSIRGAQQNPDIAERLFVINWMGAARQGSDYDVPAGRSYDAYNEAAFNQMSSWLKNAYTAVALAENPQGTVSAHEKEFYPNVLQFARIWRAYLMSEFTDDFGPAPLDGFQGNAPTFSSEKDVYYWMLDELADAIGKIDTSVEPNASEKKNDPAYEFNAAKWKNYAISLRMRLAMRLSEVDPDKAKSEFEAAVKQGQGITTADGTFRVQEYPGWDDWSGVMSRSWDSQIMTATMANLTTNLGGANSVDALAKVVKSTTTDAEGNEVANRYAAYVKDASNYLGLDINKHAGPYTDNPTKQTFFDGLPSKVDPRALKYFFLPGDYANRLQTGYVGAFNSEKASHKQWLMDKDKKAEATVDATFAWNGLNAGYGHDEAATNNGLINGSDIVTGSYGAEGTYPAIADDYRNNTNKRVFFGPWETYFLLAEAAERGWSVGTTAKDAYYAGIKASFEYNDMEDLYDAYIASDDYNRVGTSVNWDHTTEPTATQMTIKSAYTGAESTVTYNYPNAQNIMYPGKKLNDHMTKIITQLYIANTPWLPLENWNNHRRLGLPFFEIPTSTMSLTNMPEWSVESYKKAQNINLFVQRLKYPTTLQSSDADGYKQAVGLLKGGVDSQYTPLWWAIGGH